MKVLSFLPAMSLAYSTMAIVVHHPSLFKRDIQCSVPGYGTAGSPFINDGINHLNGVNICDLEAGVWTRVTCSGQSAIYAKNNLSTRYITPCHEIADRATVILDQCCTSSDCHSENRGRSFQGQDQGANFNVIIASGSC